jgi:Spy/CpxP family protein refolding chaperone
MFRPALGVLAAVLMVGTLVGDDKKDAPKGKATLPTYFKSLGLNDEQTAKVKKIHAEYRDKIDDLKAKLKEAEAAEKSEYDKILTADQKKKLREILEKKVLGEPTKAEK